MRKPLPYVILLLCLGSALVILFAGIGLSRKEERRPLVSDRAALTDFAGAMLSELRRLDALYLSHLERVARDTAVTSPFEVKDACEKVVGIRQFILQQPEKGLTSTLYLANEVVGGRQLLPPALAEVSSEEAGDSGWIGPVDGAWFYWHRRSGEEVIWLRVDPVAVSDTISHALLDWLPGAFAGLRASGDRVVLRSPRGNPMEDSGPWTDLALPPDLVLPLRTRFATWELATWDRWETLVSYDAPTLTVAGVLAGVIALLGVFAFVQQRRVMGLAEQRVSFVNRVSHELRSPLTNILLNADLALETARSEQSAAVKRLEIVREEAGRLGRMIANVLTFSNRDRGMPGERPVECVPDELIEDLLDTFEAAFKRNSISVVRELRARDRVVLDADSLAQLLGNLLSNAEKYAPVGHLHLSSYIAEERLEILVEDEGPGIPREAAERVFLPFERLNPGLTEGVSGTGLGLTIARDLAARMGGSLDLLPSEGGARFRLRLPVKPANIVELAPPLAS
ncbi:MAG: sensor histidine kinase [Verrucomicrobiales bacterium]